MKPTPPNNKRKRIHKINAFTYALLVKHLWEGIYTCKELSEMLGCHYVTVCQYTREMHRVKAVHIAGWQPDSRDRDAIKIYKLGPGKDKARRKLSASERQRRHREAKRGRIASVFLLGAISEGVRSEDGASVAA